MNAVIRTLMTLAIGIFIFVGLPLLAWGIGDAAGFMDQSARLGYVLLVVMLQLVVLIKIPGVGGNRGGKKGTTPYQRITLLLLQLVPLAIVVTAPYGDRRAIGVLAESALVRYAGLGLFAFGFSGMHWAEAFLDKQFSVEVAIQPDHQLVTSGPYRYLRHPRYLGIVLFTAGIALIFRSWLALILVAVLTLVLVFRIRDEEVMMHQAFGPEWETYAGRTWRLIPFVH